MKQNFWIEHWKKRSQLSDEINVSGWGSKQIKEYLYDIDDIAKKLKLKKSDVLLNIGCANGLMELLLNYWLRHIDSIDFCHEMIKKAQANNKANKNVSFYVGNILDLNFLKNRYDKILCNSVIQYLNGLDEVKKAFYQIRKVCKENVQVLISANPDKSKLKQYLDGYDCLQIGEEEKLQKKEATKQLLWTAPVEVAKIAMSLGFKAKVLKMNPKVWQSWYMYDLLLQK